MQLERQECGAERAPLSERYYKRQPNATQGSFPIAQQQEGNASSNYHTILMRLPGW